MGRLVQDEHYGEIYYVFLQDLEVLRHLEVFGDADARVNLSDP